MNKKAACPNCGNPSDVNKVNQWRPFCSERCKLVDLGAWFDESHRIPSEENIPIEDADDINFVKH